MRDHQDDVGVAAADLAHLAQVIRIAQASCLRYMQRQPGSALIQHFELVMRQEVEDASLDVLVAARPVVADHGIVGLHAYDAWLA